MRKGIIVKIAALLLCLGLVAACVTTKNTSAPVIEPDFHVIGYSTSWSGNVNTIDMDGYTILNYSFALPREDGSLKSLDNSYKLEALVEAAAENNVQVYLAVGGWSDGGQVLDERFEVLGADPAARRTLINELLVLCEEYGLHGIDLDWEYPGPEQESIENFEALVVDLSKELKKRGLGFSAAVPAMASAGDYYTDTALECFDHINLMVYDGDAGAGHSPFEYAESAVDYYMNTRGMDPAKLMLGLPFYARPNWTDYRALVVKDPEVVPFQDEYDGNYYNGLALIERKTRFALEQGLGGVMVWEVAGDATGDASLLNRIKEVLSEQQ